MLNQQWNRPGQTPLERKDLNETTSVQQILNL